MEQWEKALRKLLQKNVSKDPNVICYEDMICSKAEDCDPSIDRMFHMSMQQKNNYINYLVLLVHDLLHMARYNNLKKRYETVKLGETVKTETTKEHI